MPLTLNADALQRVVAAELAAALPNVDDVLSEFVVALLAEDGVTAQHVEESVAEFLEGRAGEFAAWLFSHLEQNAPVYGWTAGAAAVAADEDTRRGRGESPPPQPAAARAASRSRSREREKEVERRWRGRGRGCGGGPPPPPTTSVFDRLGPRVGAAAARVGRPATAPAPPTATPPPSDRVVIVKNVHFDATPAEVAALLTAAGVAVASVSIARGHSGRPKGFALVECLDAGAARAALRVAGAELKGRAVDVVADRRSEGEGAVPVASTSFGRGRARGRGRGLPRAARGRGRAASLTYIRPEARKAQLDAELDALRSAAPKKA